MKKILVLSVIFVALTGLSGCTGKTADNSGSLANRDFRRPDFGQPEEPVDIRGLVSSIIGNEVSVLKIDRPQFGNTDGENAGDQADSQDNARPLALGNATGGGQFPGAGGGRVFNGSGRPNADENTQAQMLERIKAMASGEEKVLIPVGIRMLKPDTASESKEPAMVEASLADIKTDTMLQIWLDKSVTDRNVASFVLVMY